MAITSETHGGRRVSLVLLFLGVYLLLAVSWQEVSLLQFDDATYLDSGRYVHGSMFLNGLTTMPLYASWFKLLSLVCADPVWRYFLSWGLLTTMAVLLPVVFKVRLGWLYAGILFSVSFFQIQPYVSLFASVFFVAALCILLKRRSSLAGSAAVACGACFLVAYSRPEYQYGVFFSALGVLTAAIAERKAARQGIAGAVAAAVLLAAAMGYVVKHSDAGRSGVAFAQHYNLKAAAKGLIPHDNEWDSSYAYDVFGVKGFGTAAAPTITTFFHANPRLFLAFVRSNVFSPMTLLLVGGLAAMIWWTWRSDGRDDDKRDLRPASLFILLISLPTLLSMSLVYPDKHYLSIVFPALLLFGLQLVPPERAAHIGRLRWVPALLLLLTIALSLRKSLVVDRLMTRPRQGMEAVNCIRELDRQPANGSLTGFDSTHTAGVYLRSSRRFVHAEDFHGWKEFDDWATATHPDWILESAGHEERYGATQEQFLQLVERDMGYLPHACPGDLQVMVYTAPAR